MRDPKIAKQTIERDGDCQRCKTTEDLCAHHMEALADGGADSFENMITLCDTCHYGWHHRCEGWVTFEVFMSQSLKIPNKRKERQIEGIEKAKAAGIYKGRKPSIDRAKLMLLIEQGKGVTEIANALNIGRASIYRILKSQNESAGLADA